MFTSLCVPIITGHNFANCYAISNCDFVKLRTLADQAIAKLHFAVFWGLLYLVPGQCRNRKYSDKPHIKFVEPGGQIHYKLDRPGRQQVYKSDTKPECVQKAWDY